jgi:hypothetical protein
VNIYAIDPGGIHGPTLPTTTFDRFGRPGRGMQPEARGQANIDFLTTLAEDTGGTPIVNTDDFDAELDRVFEENGSYYLVGYQSTNEERDGRFRRIDVHVNRPGATVRARRGYYAPTGAKPAASPAGADAATPSDLQHVGLGLAPGLTMRIALAPFAPRTPTTTTGADAAAGKATVAMTVGLLEQAPTAPLDEEMTVIVSATKDGGGAAAEMSPHHISFTLQPTSGEIVPHEWSSGLDLAPGRYEVRVNAHSKAYDRGASIYGDVEVPDFTKPGVSLSGIVFGMPADGPLKADDPLSTLLPVTPTTERSFARGQHVIAYVKVYQGGSDALAPIAVKAQVLDARDASSFDASATLAVDAFGAARAADYRLDLSTVDLKPGPHLLDIQALQAGSSVVRREVPFFVR